MPEKFIAERNAQSIWEIYTLESAMEEIVSEST